MHYQCNGLTSTTICNYLLAIVPIGRDWTLEQRAGMVCARLKVLPQRRSHQNPERIKNKRIAWKTDLFDVRILWRQKFNYNPSRNELSQEQREMACTRGTCLPTRTQHHGSVQFTNNNEIISDTFSLLQQGTNERGYTHFHVWKTLG